MTFNSQNQSIDNTYKEFIDIWIIVTIAWEASCNKFDTRFKTGVRSRERVLPPFYWKIIMAYVVLTVS